MDIASILKQVKSTRGKLSLQAHYENWGAIEKKSAPFLKAQIKGNFFILPHITEE
jgi:hypothetical protein